MSAWNNHERIRNPSRAYRSRAEGGGLGCGGREARAGKARVVISGLFNEKQRSFVEFVLSHYVTVGVEELDKDKLTPLLKLRYHDSIPDAVKDLGLPQEISKVFSGFQKLLYSSDVA